MVTNSRRTRKPTVPTTPADTEPTTADTTADPAHTATEPTDTATTTDTPTGGTATTEATTDPTPAEAGAAPTGGTPAEAPVSGAPVDSGDHLKVVMVAGILGDHPDGVTASAIVDESGLRAAIVGRVLAAMETASAAVRKPPADEGGVELWVRGEADLTTVDLSTAAVRVVCPTCNRPMPRRNTVAVTRLGPATPGHNSNGQRTLGKNELRNLVRDFLHAHPGHEFTPTTIGRELGRSFGAVSNALAKLVISGEADLVREAPAIFAAPDTAAPADTATSDAEAPPTGT
ncbi:MAG: hypothetical protein ACRDQB_13540 [Thermocrispum sp.]